MKHYHINVFFSVAEVERAKEAWLESARQDGRPIPEPRYRPAVESR